MILCYGCEKHEKTRIFSTTDGEKDAKNHVNYDKIYSTDAKKHEKRCIFCDFYATDGEKPRKLR